MLPPSHRKELRQKSSSTNISPCHHYPVCIATVVTTGPKGLWDGCYKKVVYLLGGASPLVCLSLLSIKHAFWHREDRWAKNSIGALGKMSRSIYVRFETFFLSLLKRSCYFFPLKQFQELNLELRTARDTLCCWAPGAAWVLLYLCSLTLRYSSTQFTCRHAFPGLPLQLKSPRPLWDIALPPLGNSGDKMAQPHK